MEPQIPPMKTVILASGVGKRLGPIGEETPKTLVKVLGEPVLGRILDSLSRNGLRDVVITTGYQEQKIHEFVEGDPRFRGLNVAYVLNPRFAETNYIYSLWLAAGHLRGEDLLYIHGDVIYDPVLLARVLAAPGSVIAVNRSAPVAQKDLKARIQDGYVREISLQPAPGDAYLCTSICKLTKEDWAVWQEAIDEFVKRGETGCYAENAFNTVAERMALRPLYFTTEIGMDIDNAEDLAVAERLLAKGSA